MKMKVMKIEIEENKNDVNSKSGKAKVREYENQGGSR